MTLYSPYCICVNVDFLAAKIENTAKEKQPALWSIFDLILRNSWIRRHENTPKLHVVILQDAQVTHIRKKILALDFGTQYSIAFYRKDCVFWNVEFLQRAQCSHCKHCISYSNSVRPSVCPSHAGIVSKRRHVARCSLHRWIAKCV